MSQMFETDIASLLPDDNTSLAALKTQVQELTRLLVRLLKVQEDMVALERIKGECVDLLLARVERLEREAELDVPTPFPGQDDDFGLAPKSKKEPPTS